MHIVNLTSAGTWRQPVDEYIPIGPVKVRIRLSDEVRGMNLEFCVSEPKSSASRDHGWINFTINSITDHEVIVIS